MANSIAITNTIAIGMGMGEIGEETKSMMNSVVVNIFRDYTYS